MYDNGINVEDVEESSMREQMISKPKQIVNDSLFDDLKSMHKHFDREEKENDLKFTDEVKSKTLRAILISLLIGNMQVLNLSTILPLFVEKN